MAGNLVKWWKHKILGGYKQFSVQECTTDSEELMYHQVRASSSCSAPPDLLLVSDRENNIPLRSPVVNIIGNNTSTTAPATLTTRSPSSGINACPITSATNNNQRQHHHQKLLQQQQQQHNHHHVTAQQLSLAYNGTKDVNGKHQKNISGISSKHGQQQQQQQQDLPQQPQETEGQQVEAQTTTTNHISARHAHQTHHQQQQQQQQPRNEEHIRLEEFTCDVSVEGGKSSQPLQFSFTFYDLDGHHGKITKDDIVGIVYTIYESIGKSVVVPHSGSKTINVRLTVSPEGKSKAAKSKKTNAVVLDNSQTTSQKASAATSSATRRLHRYRPRKLIKSDDEDDESNSDKERDINIPTSNFSNALAQKPSTKINKFKLRQDQQCCPQQQLQAVPDLQNSPLDSIYDNIRPATTPETCRECMAAVDETRNAAISPTTAAVAAAAATQFHNSKSITNEAYMKHVASTRIKMLRKSRKQKHQDCIETRQRSLSVGNETCWKNRHLQKQPTQQQLQWHAEQQLQNTVDTVDGVQLRNPLKSSKAPSMTQKRNSAECWKTALNRNDLISIIRESMEKNRLCFQLNGKPQANVSPIRHSQQQQTHHQQHLLQHHKHSQQHQRQRSNIVSKIPTLIANHHSVSPQSQNYAHQRSSSCTNNNISNDTSMLHEHHHSNTSSNSIYHPQPHIPIYHQQMPINPAVIAVQNALSTNNAVGGALAGGHHSKMNLCGYDSFLHATICGGGLSHSPPPTAQSPLQQQSSAAAIVGMQGNGHHSHHQQIATVQPIMSSASSNLPNTHKHLGLAVTPNQIKTSKILRSGSYAQNQQQSLSAANSASPQYHGYQRLPSTSKHNLAALHLVSPSMEKPQLDQLEKWQRDQVKNYDQLLYAKLSEKLQQTNLVAPSRETRENVQRRKHHRMLRQRRSNAIIQEANNISLPTVLTTKLCIQDDTDYATMIPINGDPVECENLIGQTSDEESHHSQHQTLSNTREVHRDPLESNLQSRHVVEGTLVDLGDVNNESQQPEPSTITHSPLNVDSLLTVEAEDKHDLHLENDLEIDEDLEEDLEDELEDAVGVPESGRQSADSNDTNNGTGCGGVSATLANTNGVNNSTISSSLIHRYVHEHIHHHYHHFEEKEE